ncbi:unnamed protein product [Cyclocybe aegerita]|uniref:Meiotically up-regulated protein Msb1/Mug8 domain-containing protein n=1 Tax=Cyclocybe aegerita TaxID=1973307 RepID=A0A8S0VZQ2_CYCAE|nr:unnamed protein product [Cyclocybe aegerita]
MHSFLSKVFGRKKDDRDASPPMLAPGELLDGKFEAVSPNVSPSATHFLELDQKANGKDKERGRDAALPLFKANKSRPSSPEVNTRKLDTLPHLSLNFADLKAQSAYFFDTDPDAHILLTDAVIGQRRLNPMEALVLIRACSQAIVARGLETLGIMHPHWYSASPDIQRRLISQFIHSLDAHSPETALSAVSPSPISNFESELNFTRDPHDVAAVLRWGLRHVQLEGDSFGTDDGWYKAFLDAEAAADYPPKAFSEILAPKLPPAHLELLTATLEIISSLAPLAEANSTSGSKLSKIFGLWLLTARHVEEKDDWKTFYARWERTGRMLEHLFLCRIRDESTDQRMPIRLLELVRKYPYTQGLSPPTTDLQLLPRPRFTTSIHDALFVRIEIELASFKRKPKTKVHPVDLLADAFSTKVEEGEYAEVWAKVIAASKGGDHPSSLSNIFADETIRFLSLVPDKRKEKDEVKSPTFSLLPSSASPRQRSFSVTETDKSAPIATQHTKPATDPTPITPISPLAIGSDWAQFSTSGFIDVSPAIPPLASTLFDTDLEKTAPPDPPVPLLRTLSRRSSKRAKAPAVEPASLPRKSTESSTTAAQVEPDPQVLVRATNLHIVQLDEAFIDFWSDALLDPISADSPTFVVCKFKSTLVPELTYGPSGVEVGQLRKTLKWLVLEQVYTLRPPPPPPPVVIPETPVRETARPSSPAQSTSGKRRFNFWNSISRTASSSSDASLKGKKTPKSQNVKVGEMGELIEEEDVKPAKGRKSLDSSRKDKGKAKEEDSKPKEVKPKDEVKVKPEEKTVPKEEQIKDGVSTAAVAAIATGAVAAGAAAAVLSSEGPEVVKTEEAEVEKVVEGDEVKPETVAEVVTTADGTPAQEPAVNEADKAPVEEVAPTPEAAVEAEVPVEDAKPAPEVPQPVEAEAVVPVEDAKPASEVAPPEAEALPVKEIKPLAEAISVDEVKETSEALVIVEASAQEEKPAGEIPVEEDAPASIPTQLQEAIDSDHIVPESTVEETPAVVGEATPAAIQEAPASVDAETKDAEPAVIPETSTLEEAFVPAAVEVTVVEEVAVVPQIAREASADAPTPVEEPAAARLAEEIFAPVEAEIEPVESTVAAPAMAEAPIEIPSVIEEAAGAVPPVVEETSTTVETKVEAPAQEVEAIPVVAAEEDVPIPAVEEAQPEAQPAAEAPAPEAAVVREEVSLVKTEEDIIPSVVEESPTALIDSTPTPEPEVKEVTEVGADVAPVVAEEVVEEVAPAIEEATQVEPQPQPAPIIEIPAIDATIAEVAAPPEAELNVDNIVPASASVPEPAATSKSVAISEVKGPDEQEADVIPAPADEVTGTVETKVDEIVVPVASISEAEVMQAGEPGVEGTPAVVKDVGPVPAAVEEEAQVFTQPEDQEVAEVQAPEAPAQTVEASGNIEEKELVAAPATVEESPPLINDAVAPESKAEDETNETAPGTVPIEDHASGPAVEVYDQAPIEPVSTEALISEETDAVDAEANLDVVAPEVVEVASQVVDEPPLTPAVVGEEAHLPAETVQEAASEEVAQDVSAEEVSLPVDTQPDAPHKPEAPPPGSTAEAIVESSTKAQDISTITDVKQDLGESNVQPIIEPEAPALEVTPETVPDAAPETVEENVGPVPTPLQEETQAITVLQTAQEDVSGLVVATIGEDAFSPTPLSVGEAPVPLVQETHVNVPVSVATEVQDAEREAPPAAEQAVALEPEDAADAAVANATSVKTVEEKTDDAVTQAPQAVDEPEVVSAADAAPVLEANTDAKGFSNEVSVPESDQVSVAEEVVVEVSPAEKGNGVAPVTVAEEKPVAPAAAEDIAEEGIPLQQEAPAPSKPDAQSVVEEAVLQTNLPAVNAEAGTDEITPEVIGSSPTIDEGDAVVLANEVEKAVPAAGAEPTAADITPAGVTISAISGSQGDEASASTEAQASIHSEGVIPDDTLAVEPQVAVEGPSQAVGETDAAVPEAPATVKEPTSQEITPATVGTTTIVDVEQSILAEAEATSQEQPQVIEPEIQAIAVDEHATLTLPEEDDEVVEPQPEIDAQSTTVEEVAPNSASTRKTEIASTISAEPETNVAEPAILSASDVQTHSEIAPILERAAPTQNEPEIGTEDSNKADDPQVHPPALVDTQATVEESVVPQAQLLDEGAAVGEKEIANEISTGEQTWHAEVTQGLSADIAPVKPAIAASSQPQIVDEPASLVAPVVTSDVTASVVEDPAPDGPSAAVEKRVACADVAEPAVDEPNGDKLVTERAGVSPADLDVAPAISETDTASTPGPDEVTPAVEDPQVLADAPEEPGQGISLSGEGKEVDQEAPAVVNETVGQPAVLEAPVAVVVGNAVEETMPAAENQPSPAPDVAPEVVDEAVAAVEEHVEEPAAEPSLPAVENPTAAQPIPEQGVATEEPALVVEEAAVSIVAEDAAPIVDQIHSSLTPQEPTREETVPAETTILEERESRTTADIAEPIPQAIEELPSTTDEPSQTAEEPSSVVQIPTPTPEEVEGSQEGLEEATSAVEELTESVEDVAPTNETTSAIDDLSPAVLESSTVEPLSLPADIPNPTVEEAPAASEAAVILEQPSSEVVLTPEVVHVEVKAEPTQFVDESKPEAEENVPVATSTPLAAAEESTSAVEEPAVEGLASEVLPTVAESASVLEEPVPAVEALPQVIEVTTSVPDHPTFAFETLVGEEANSHKPDTSVELEGAITGPASTTDDLILAQEDSPVPVAEPEAVAVGEPAVAEETPTHDDPNPAHEQTVSEDPTTVEQSTTTPEPQVKAEPAPVQETLVQERTAKLTEETALVIPTADAASSKDEIAVNEPVVAPQFEETKADEEPATIVEESPVLEDNETLGTIPAVIEGLGEDEPVDETTPSPQSIVVSSEPRIEPVSIPSDDSADHLVDLPPVPVIAATPVVLKESIILPFPEPSSPEASSEPAPSNESVAAKDNGLPSAPESVVLSGSTPGPEVALSTSKPAALEKTLDELDSSFSGTEISNGNGHHVSSGDSKAAIAEGAQAPTATNGQAAVEDAPVFLDSAVPESVEDVDVPANGNEYRTTATETLIAPEVATDPETAEKND